MQLDCNYECSTVFFFCQHALLKTEVTSKLFTQSEKQQYTDAVALNFSLLHGRALADLWQVAAAPWNVMFGNHLQWFMDPPGGASMLLGHRCLEPITV